MFVQVSAHAEEQQEKIKAAEGVGGVETAVKKIQLFVRLYCLISLRGLSSAQSMRSSKENQGESILAQLTEIKRLRRALASGIMEYGISHPASRPGVASSAALSLNYARPRTTGCLFLHL